MSNKQNKTISFDEVKAAKMRHYSRRDPNVFVQFDGIYMPFGGDSVMIADNDNDVIISGKTVELMNGADVRVLIRDPRSNYGSEATILEIARMLRKIADMVERLGNTLGDDVYSSDESIIEQTCYEDRCPQKYNDKSCFECAQREQCYNASPGAASPDTHTKPLFEFGMSIKE